MSKEKNAAVNPYFRELFQSGIYKRSQGRVARQVTWAGMAAVILLGAYRLSLYEVGAGRAMQFWLPSLFVLIGLWMAYRLVNLPSFADFLISVEAEMNKVSWPTRTELVRSSLVVIFSIMFLVVVLYAYDLFWKFLLQRVLHILH